MSFDAGIPEDPLHAGFHSLESLNEAGFAPGPSVLFHPQNDLELLT